MPVLWTPLSGTEDPPGLRKALALGADEPGYAENGLRPMLKIRSYHDSYQAVVNLLAKQIVVLAEKSPIDPSEVPDIDEMKSAFTPEAPLAVFAIETAAPTARTAAAGRDPLATAKACRVASLPAAGTLAGPICPAGRRAVRLQGRGQRDQDGQRPAHPQARDHLDRSLVHC